MPTGDRKRGRPKLTMGRTVQQNIPNGNITVINLDEEAGDQPEQFSLPYASGYSDGTCRKAKKRK